MATYDLAYPGAAIDAILNTAYFLQEAGYIFQGSASEYSGTPSKRVWLIAPAGFSGLGLSSAVPQGSIGICLYNGTAWVGKIINVLTLDSAPTRNSQNGVTSGGVAATLDAITRGIMETFASLLFDDETASADLRTKLSYAVKFSVSDVYQTVTHLNILAATTSKAGLMSAEDKAKVDSFLTNLRSLTFADTTASADQATQITETLKATIGGVQEVIDSITLLAATSSKAGLLSASDKAYIDALPATLTNLSNSISGALALMQSLVGYYVCDTAAGTAAKTVAATGYSLTNGGCIRIKMNNANTAANVTLNINSTGAKALYYDGAQASSSNSWDAGEVLEVYYDGTQYQCASGGGGKFATGEKVKEVGITNTLTNDTKLIESKAVYDVIGGVPSAFLPLDISGINAISYFPNPDWGWIVYNNFESKIIPVPTGTRSIRITASGAGDARIAFLASGTVPTANNQPIDYATGENTVRNITQGTTATFILPTDCTYIAVGTKTTVNITPTLEYSAGATLLDMIGDNTEQIEKNTSDLSLLISDYTVHESDLTWQNGGLQAENPASANYDTITSSSVLKTSEYVAIPKGDLIYTFPIYQSNTSFGIIFYDKDKNPLQNYVIRNGGSFGSEVVNLTNTAYSFVRFVWFQASTYGEFYLKVKSVNTLTETDVEEIVQDVMDGVDQTITSWTSNKGIEAVGTHKGRVNDSTVCDVSDYIDIKGFRQIRMPLVEYIVETTFGYLFYDSSKQIIDGAAFSYGGDSYSMYEALITVPSNAAYLRTCKLHTYTDDFIVTGYYTGGGKSYILVAASDSEQYDKDRADFVCTGSHDEETINQACAALRPYQDIHFAKGKYIIDAFFPATDGQYDYVICWPQGTPNNHRIVCEGGQPFRKSENVDAIDDLADAAVFKISQTCYDALDATKQYCIIRTNSNNGARHYLANAIQVEGIAFIIPDNQKKIICIDGKFASYIDVRKCSGACVKNVNALSVPIEGSIGVRGVMGSNYGIYNVIEHSCMWGFYECFAVAGEHLIMTECVARFGWYGYTFNNFTNLIGMWVHPMTIINCADENNYNMPLFAHNGDYQNTSGSGGKQSITFINFNFEWTNDGRWQDEANRQLAKEISPGEWFGEIYYVVQTNWGANTKNSVSQAFWKNDGSGINMKSVNQAHSQQVTKAVLATYAPNYNQIVYVTDLHMPLICTNPNIPEWRDFSGNIVEI